MNHVRKAFDSLLYENEFIDVTLSCEGKKVHAHKMLLSACSPYFRDLFKDNPCQHPIVILKDVKYQVLKDLLKFMYNGEVSVASEDFDAFLKTAEQLKISGLTDEMRPSAEPSKHAAEKLAVETQPLSVSPGVKRKKDKHERETRSKRRSSNIESSEAVPDLLADASNEQVNEEYGIEYARIKKEIHEDIKVDGDTAEMDPLSSEEPLDTLEGDTFDQS